jgi:hypothetical protein
VVALLVQFGIFARLLQRPLRSGDAAVLRGAAVRWIKVSLAWQVLVLAGSAAYVIGQSSSHPPGFDWIAPALGAVLGTALPLQLVVVSLMRSMRS